MPSGARVTAYLGLDIAAFSSGLEKAQGLASRFKNLLRQGDFGGFGKVLGAGAIIQGFRAAIDRAQEARDRARELGKAVDASTTSVARYGDAWDEIKNKIADAAVVGLGFFTQIGEKFGEFFSDEVVARFRGITPEQSKKNRKIADDAEANANRLSSPEALAAAKRRGEEKKRKAEDAENKKMTDVAGLMNEGLANRDKAALDALPIAQQLVKLEQQRVSLQKDYANTKNSILTRANAFRDLTKVELQITEKKKEQEKEITEERKKQADAAEKEKKELADARAEFRRELDPARKARDDARADLAQARQDLQTQRDDPFHFTLGEAATGVRGNTASRFRARRIERDEEMARRLHDSGNVVTEFDAVTQRNVQRDWRSFRDRAAAARQTFEGLKSTERDPFAQSAAQLTKAGQTLEAAAAHLRDVEIVVNEF